MLEKPVILLRLLPYLLFWLLLRWEKIRGNSLESSGLRLGSEAQMMATLHSTADQVAAPGLSPAKVGESVTRSPFQKEGTPAAKIGSRTGWVRGFRNHI